MGEICCGNCNGNGARMCTIVLDDGTEILGHYWCPECESTFPLSDLIELSGGKERRR
jgi:hypothetical protein